MPRTARLVVPGMPHHITQRGTRRFEVFRDNSDRADHMALFSESCKAFALRIVAYCLMTNHVHYVAIPGRADSIGGVFHRVHGTYSKRFNIKYGFVGHLWQERPFSCVLEESHFWNAIRYVEQNPVRAGMVGRAEEYPWSSAPAHCSGGSDPLLSPDLALTGQITNWATWLACRNDAVVDQFIRDCTFTGRPCGDEAFVRQLEQDCHRDFTRKKPGPRPKANSEKSLALDWSDDRIVR